MKAISEGRRWQIVFKAKELGSVKRAAEACKVNLKTAYKWVNRYRISDNGIIKALRKPGPHRIMSDKAARTAADEILSQQMYAETIAIKLFNEGIVSRIVHKSTLIRSARTKEDLVAVRGKPRRDLTKTNMQKRLDFAKRHSSRGWGNVLFTDRKRFDFKYPGVKVLRVTWCRKNEKPRAFSVNHPQSVNLYAGICKHGVTTCPIVSGTSKYKTPYKTKSGKAAKNIVTEEYAEVLKNTLLPEGNTLFDNNGQHTWILQQDGDPVHNQAKMVVKKFNEDSRAAVSVLYPWPGNSPDLNPIENLWSIVDAKVQARGCKSFEEFQQAVLAEMKAVTRSLCAKLCNSMSKRLTLTRKNKGGRIRY